MTFEQAKAQARRFAKRTGEVYSVAFVDGEWQVLSEFYCDVLDVRRVEWCTEFDH